MPPRLRKEDLSCFMGQDMFVRAAGCAELLTIDERDECEETAVWNATYIGGFKFLCVCIAVWKVEDINRRAMLAFGT